MKAEKKENMLKMRAQKKAFGKTNKINMINLILLAAGLLLMALGMKEIGNYVICACVFVFFITALSGILTSISLRKQK